MLVRARLFYARPRRVPHTAHIIAGLSDKRQIWPVLYASGVDISS